MTFKNFRLNNYLGYAILIVALISYKLRYTISLAFLNPELIIILAIVLGIVGLYLALKAEQHKLNKKNVSNETLLERLRLKGERIILNTNNCEVRENNYYEEVVDNSMNTAAVADSLYDPNRNVRQNYIVQTAIVYYYQTGQNKIKFTSQTFPYAKEILEQYLDNGSLILYVDRFNKKEYAFDFRQ